MLCFDIIDAEHISYDLDKAKKAKEEKEFNERMNSPHIRPPKMTG